MPEPINMGGQIPVLSTPVCMRFVRINFSDRQEMTVLCGDTKAFLGT